MNLTEIIGKTILKIEGDFNSEEISFLLSNGEKYVLKHNQNCCETVLIDDIVGDLKDLLYKPLLEATCRYKDGKDDECTSSTWTFFHFATIKGYVTITWYGESNGYYSESAELIHLGTFKKELSETIKKLRLDKINKIV